MSDNPPATPETTTTTTDEDENSSVSTKAESTQLDDTLNSENKLDLTGKTEQGEDKQEAAKSAGDEATPAKITITFRHVGNAPILKRNKFMLERTRNVHFIIEWLKKFMKLDPVKDQLFLYVNQEFSPSPDVEIGTLYDCFRVGNNVILHYCTTPAWG